MAGDTIAAISTPPGAGGIGVVRVSGPTAADIARRLCTTAPVPRTVRYVTFRDDSGLAIDQGLLLYFEAPASYTGEDIAEFHAHGSIAVLDQLLARTLALGARHARPGEFTERAFRNGKLDLAQAEAVADLIASRTARAARSTMRALRGEFSRRIDALVDTLTGLRARLEAAIDFPDELGEVAILPPALVTLQADLGRLLAGARHGARLCAGASVAIVGAPNVGKSTLLNALCGGDRAIVSPQAGTTRDVIEVDISVAGMPMRVCDTAGLHDSRDTIEQEGIRRAHAAMRLADLILLVVTDRAVDSGRSRLADADRIASADTPVITVHNKIDADGAMARIVSSEGETHVFVSARDIVGIDLLQQAILAALGSAASEDDEFSARARHVAALEEAAALLAAIDTALLNRSPEIVADIYRLAARALGEITGATTNEDLLGEIFSRFCIGK